MDRDVRAEALSSSSTVRPGERWTFIASARVPGNTSHEVRMAYPFIFGCFLLLGAVSSLAAHVGYRGKVCDRSVGYEVPAKVRSDPALRKRANSLVAFWCTGAALLGFAPLVPLGSVILSDGGKSVSTWGLVAFAAYGLVVVTVGACPFEKIKQLGGCPER